MNIHNDFCRQRYDEVDRALDLQVIRDSPEIVDAFGDSLEFLAREKLKVYKEVSYPLNLEIIGRREFITQFGKYGKAFTDESWRKTLREHKAYIRKRFESIIRKRKPSLEGGLEPIDLIFAAMDPLSIKVWVRNTLSYFRDKENVDMKDIEWVFIWDLKEFYNAQDEGVGMARDRFTKLNKKYGGEES
jgi:hypothetical protein